MGLIYTPGASGLLRVGDHDPANLLAIVLKEDKPMDGSDTHEDELIEINMSYSPFISIAVWAIR